MKTIKAIATGVAAVGALGVIGGVGPAGTGAPSAVQVRPVAVGAPLPLDPAPAAAVPTTAQLTTLLNTLADPNVPFESKSNLIEGGISGTEAHMADHEFKKAAKHGDLPLAFNVTNIQPAPAGAATADVAVSGPKINPPVTENVTFVNQGSWILARASAMTLLQAAGH